MESLDRMREEFEAWWVREECNANKAAAWEGWQASRACLVVTLPQMPGIGATKESRIRNAMRASGIEDCRTAIESAGIKTSR